MIIVHILYEVWIWLSVSLSFVFGVQSCRESLYPAHWGISFSTSGSRLAVMYYIMDSWWRVWYTIQQCCFGEMSPYILHHQQAFCTLESSLKIAVILHIMKYASENCSDIGWPSVNRRLYLGAWVAVNDYTAVWNFFRSFWNGRAESVAVLVCCLMSEMDAYIRMLVHPDV